MLIEQAKKLLEESGFIINEKPKYYLHKYIRENTNSEIYTMTHIKEQKRLNASKAFYAEVNPNNIDWIEYDPHPEIEEEDIQG